MVGWGCILDAYALGTVLLPANSDAQFHVRLLREVTTGPSSVVFVGSCQSDFGTRLVAMKLVHPGSEDALEQLLHQRDSQRRLAGVGFRGILPATSLVRLGDYPAFMSEWVDGLDLLDWVEVLREQRLRMPGSVVCELVRNVASTLDAALSQPPWPSKQALRVLHGDLKPSNILIHRDGEVRVTDFGTGFTSRAGRGGRSGALKRGLAKYLAPERREGGAASAESDMYALGVIALELFRGRWLRRLHSKNPAHDRHLADTWPLFSAWT